MIDFEFVQSLIRALDESSLDSLELERGGTRIRLSKSAGSILRAEAPISNHAGAPGSAGPPSAVPAEAPVGVAAAASEPAPGSPGVPEAEEGNFLEVTSPMVGTFYRAPAPDADPYVDVGSPVQEGTVLCIIEAMKLMNELESDVKGTIAKILVENAEPVEYGQVLFLIEPS